MKQLMKATSYEIQDEKVLRQFEFISKVSQLITARTLNDAVKPKAFTDTFGCQQNVADTQKIIGMLVEMGYEMTSDETEAQIYIINSCAVREHAELKILSKIGKLKHLKKANPNLIIAVCGCMVQQEHIKAKLKNSYPFVDIVFGTFMSYKFPELLYKSMTLKKRIFETSENEDKTILEGMPVFRESTTKAFISIMYGCNNFCTYCIVPYVRGRERSRYPEKIRDELLEVVKDGCREITLLGQNVNSYGKDLDVQIDFSSLLRLLNEVEGDFVIRFMTSHPKDASLELIDTMAECDKIAKQLHLPFQSGSDKVLKEMNRHYTSEQYLKLINYAKEKMPDIILTSDVMVGFPTETNEDFEDTLHLVKQIEFNALFTFIYSRRSGTPAADMEFVLSKEEIQKNFEKLVNVQNDIAAEHNLKMVGKVYDVIIEGKSKNRDFPVASRTFGGTLVLLKDESLKTGEIIKAKILDSSLRAVFGEPQSL